MGRKQRGKCLFCEKVEDLSLEDVLPIWLAKELHELYPGPWMSTFEKTDWVSGSTWGNYKPRDHIRVKHRCLCEPCNNRWLSVLENDVKPLIKPMLRGEDVDLSQDQQRDLAFWCVKTSQTYDAKQGSTHIPREHMRWVYEHRETRELWPDVKVGLAWYIGGRPWEANITGLSEKPLENLPERPPKRVLRQPELVNAVPAYLWTARFAQLVLQVSGIWPGVIDPPIKDVELPRYSIGIWPNSPVTRLWPPDFPMNDPMFQMYGRTDESPQRE